MPINKFNADGLLSQEDRQSSNDLFYIKSVWHSLSYWQRKKIGLRMRYYVARHYAVKHFEAVRAVTMPAVYGAGMAAACGCDLLLSSGLFTLLLPLAFSTRLLFVA